MRLTSKTGSMSLSRAIHDAMKGVKPRKFTNIPFTDELLLSGLEAMRIGKFTNFVNIGERCNVAGSRYFCRLIKEDNYDVRFVSES